LDKSVLPVTEGFFLFYPSRRQNSAALRALIDFLRGEFAPKRRRRKAPIDYNGLAALITLPSLPYSSVAIV
jgi:hypothetical protein